MAFVITDLYLTQGSVELVNNWPNGVVKYTSNGFYNWEEDNQPIYDLEDRTDYLWEKAGYPIRDGFSGVPGISIVVSADAFNPGGLCSSITTDSSGKVFKNVSAAINALPNPISIPIIIEVASFGELGELNLNGIQFVKNGGLEIVNRAFGKIYSGSSIFSGTAPYNLSSTELDSTLLATSALAISAVVTSAASDTRWNANVIAYFTQAPFTSTGSRLTTDADIYFGLGAGTTFDMGAGEFELGAGYTDAVSENYDVSVVHPISGQQLTRLLTPTGVNARVTGFVFGNKFSKVKVKGCQGPLYIRNFAVDGKNNTTPSVDVGWDIVNSNLLIENCLATRCNKQGFRFVGSDVIVSRGLAAHRNYTISGTTMLAYRSAGVQAINSNLFCSSHLYGSAIDNIFQSSRNRIGIDLINSQIIGGDSRLNAPDLSRTNTTNISFLQAFYNNTGIQCKSSNISYDGRVDVFNNEIGIDLKDSDLAVAEMDVSVQQNEGIKSEGSTILINKDLYQFPQTTLDNNNFQQFIFLANGTHAKLLNSTMTHPDVSSIPTRCGKTYFLSAHGVNNINTNKTSIPNIVLENSLMELIHPVIRTAQGQSNFLNNEPIYGACISARRGSTVKLKGSRNGVTLLMGFPGVAEQKHVAAVYGGEDSIIDIMGPTVICQAAIDVLVEDGSVARFLPHMRNGNLDVSGWELTNPNNHTKVELFSQRACIVANRGANVIMENLGDYGGIWPANQTSACDYNLSNDFTTSAYVSAGYMQFYPNGQDDTALTASANRYNVTANSQSISFDSDAAGLTARYLMFDYWAASSAGNIEKFSNGGMCVRALGGSHVKTKNVHFPCGWSNPSGTAYDTSSGTASQLRIWNIADDSTLDASYCSVSGNYPGLVTYNGPSAFYSNGTSIATSATITTPDFGVTSLLDFFGASGTVAGTNYGPFRIYVSPVGPAKQLYYVSATNGIPVAYDHPYQVWAQGYNASGPVSGSYLLRDMGYQQFAAVSGFYHTSAMLDASHKNNIRLDESATNSFANAKNGVVGKAGRIPIFTTYKANTDVGGEAHVGTINGTGRGFMSANIFDLSRKN